LDVRMPGMSGIDVLRRIRQVDADLPVVLVTGHADEADVAEARDLGVAEVIWKPEILTNLDEVLGELREAEKLSSVTEGVAGTTGGWVRRAGSASPPASGGLP